MLVSTAVQIPLQASQISKDRQEEKLKKQLQKEVIALPDHYKTFWTITFFYTTKRMNACKSWYQKQIVNDYRYVKVQREDGRQREGKIEKITAKKQTRLKYRSRKS